MSVSVDKLNQLARGGIGSKQSFIEYRRGNLITAFSKYARPHFDILVSDTNVMFAPVTGFQKAVTAIWPELTTLSAAEKGSCALHKADLNTTAKKDYYVAMLVIHDLIGDPKEKVRRKEINLFVAFRKAFTTLIEFSIATGRTIGMPTIGNKDIWSELELIVNEVCEALGYDKQIYVYRPKAKRNDN